MSLIRKHVAVLQAWACLDLVRRCYTTKNWTKVSKSRTVTEAIHCRFEATCLRYNS